MGGLRPRTHSLKSCGNDNLPAEEVSGESGGASLTEGVCDVRHVTCPLRHTRLCDTSPAGSGGGAGGLNCARLPLSSRTSRKERRQEIKEVLRVHLEVLVEVRL